MRWVLLIALLLATGCDSRRQGYPLRPDVGASDPTSYSGLLYEGKWQRSQETTGYAWLNAWDDSTIDCMALWKSYGIWGPALNRRGGFFRGLATFSLRVNADSTLSSYLRGIWLSDSTGTYSLPLPDSLGLVRADVGGWYTSTDSFWVAQEQDTTTLQWHSVYLYERAFNLRFSIGGSRLETRTLWEKVRRVGLHGGGEQ